MSISFYHFPSDPIRVLGMGVFDGIHRGHQVIVDQCTHVMSFWPHPVSVLDPQTSIPRLTTLDDMRILSDKVFALAFNSDVAGCEARRFFDEVIVHRLGPKTIVVGADFRFGSRQQGTPDRLTQWAADCGIQVRCIDLVQGDSGFIKSTIIRQAIQSGEFARALDLLGHPYVISGRVCPGDGRGKRLGFPTANIDVHSSKLLPPSGVYGGYVTIQEQRYLAIVYIGNRPTYGHTAVGVEVHVLHFSGHLYDQSLAVFLTDFIRGQETFLSSQALVRAIQADIDVLNRRQNLTT